jgi:hypothetical protein
MTRTQVRALGGPDPMFRFHTSWPSVTDLGYFRADAHSWVEWLENLLIWQRHDAGEQSEQLQEGCAPFSFRSIRAASVGAGDL